MSRRRFASWPARPAPVLALALALASSVLLLASACLPDLAPFPAGPDAGEGNLGASFGCGDGVIETLDDGGDAGESCDPGDAGIEGCSSCQFVCPGGAIDEAGHCYFVTSPTETYQDALRACANASAHVVTLASLREARFVDAVVEDAGRAEAGYWVGLDQQNPLGDAYGASNPSEPGYPRDGSSCSGCFARGDDAGAFAPLPDAGGGRCVVALGDSWHQAPCSEGHRSFATLCEREPVGQRIYACGGLLCTTTTVTAGKKRYVIWQFPATAEEARERCQSSYDGGGLVMFDSNEEREQLVREIVSRLQAPASSEPLEVWIGLAFREGQWLWDDGEPVTSSKRPLPWGEGQPGAGLGRAFLRVAPPRVPSFDTQLAQSDEDASAGAPRVFVCQRPPE